MPFAYASLFVSQKWCCGWFIFHRHQSRNQIQFVFSKCKCFQRLKSYNIAEKKISNAFILLCWNSVSMKLQNARYCKNLHESFSRCKLLFVVGCHTVLIQKSKQKGVRGSCVVCEYSVGIKRKTEAVKHLRYYAKHCISLYILGKKNHVRHSL